MTLLPTLRQKKRYLAFEIQCSTPISVAEAKEEVNAGLLRFLGELGVAKSSPLFLEEKYKNNQGILKLNHKYVDEGKSALILIKKIKNKPVIIRSLSVSGILKKASAHL
ncbi:MAG: Rpp14/Pop5 family protein [Nanoarchaeota archaeon]